MLRNKIILLLVFILFLGFTSYCVMEFGFFGIMQEGMKNSATMQIFIDLAISLALILVWIYKDAKKHNRKFAMWLVITLIVGVFGPLLYLLTSKNKK